MEPCDPCQEAVRSRASKPRSVDVGRSEAADISHNTNVARDDPMQILLVLLRIFLFHLIETIDQGIRSSSLVTTAKPKNKQHWKDRVRLVRLAVKTGKSCLEAGQIEHCIKVLERAADHDASLEKLATRRANDEDEEFYTAKKQLCSSLRVEYLGLRMMLASLDNAPSKLSLSV